MKKQTRRATLTWAGEGRSFRGVAGDAAPIAIDGDSRDGPSPMETLLLSIAACMAIDIRDILEKGRVAVSGVEVDMVGDRAPDPPRRYTRIAMDVKVSGPSESDRPKVDRAIQLSRDKYCSVFHTLRSDLEVEIRTHLD